MTMLKAEWMKKLLVWLRSPSFFPVLLAFVLIGAYGLHIRSLGFYWDDWEDIFLYHLNSPVEFLKYFAYDRPTTIWVYLIFFPLFGDNPQLWQLFNLSLRYISLTGLWWVINRVWPARRFESSWLILLLAVFPGFYQQTISVTYSRHFMALALFSLSLVLSTISVSKPRLYFFCTLSAVLLSFIQMMTIEYFVGLEILRPLLLWVLFREADGQWSKRIFKVLKIWLPYLIPLAGFLAWRFILYEPLPGADDPNAVMSLSQLKSAPVDTLVHLTQNIVQDVIHLLIFPWTGTFAPGQINLASTTMWISWTIGAVLATIAGFSLLKPDVPGEESIRFSLDWLLIGLIALAAGGLPVWITDRQIIVGLWSDRFALGPMVGACLILVSLVSLLGYRRIQKTILLAVVLTLAISAQYRNVDRYLSNWEIQRNYYWQFFWRIPALEPGTAIFGTKMPFGLIADYSVSHAINSIYAPEMAVENIPYWFFSSMRAYGNDIPDFLPDLPVSYSIRNLKFTGSTSEGIVTNYKAGNACVSVLRPEDEYFPNLTTDEVRLAKLSNLNRILQRTTDPAATPARIFGPEPPHGWCYFYEKADLARQFQDWSGVKNLGVEAFAQGLSPAVGMEYEPFIEASIMTGNWQDAYELTTNAVSLTNGMKPSLCALWQRSALEIDIRGRDVYKQIKRELECAPEEN